MLTLQKFNQAQIADFPTEDIPIENLLTKEWLLTNERGSYASSTVAGCNTRGYHGLLIGSVNPPANRIMALANCLEMVISNKTTFNLSTFEFSDKFAPEGFRYITRFRRDIGAHFDYELSIANSKTVINLTKSIYLLRNVDTVAIVYDFINIEHPVEFILRPFVGLRDFHSLQKSYAPLRSSWSNDGLLAGYDTPNSCKLFLYCPYMKFENDQQWWFNFIYRVEKERGHNFTEDLWTPGFFKCQINAPTEVVFWANLSLSATNNISEQIKNADIDSIKEDLRRHQNSIIASSKTRDQKLEMLYLAAEQFVIKRQMDHEHRTTILAGFPWFVDWGRDAFISLPGLLLSTGRFEEAKSVLTTFAHAADQGMIPNRFDDHSDAAHFNSIDASLWFINAAFQYLHATFDSKTFTQELLPVIRWIIDSYQKGTRFDIHADIDGLITGGNYNTQLTWMDAMYNRVAFTPRYGKAVEVNALWHNALCLLTQFYLERNSENTKLYKPIAEQAGVSFCKLFWNKSLGYLNDCILPDGSPDLSLRPNQIFAVSLPFPPPLSPDEQKSIVNMVQKELLTPYGLRTLNTSNKNYRGKYIGSPKERDEAYHQGTVWPYLIGPFVEAYLKVNHFRRESKKKADEFIQPLLQHLTEDCCLGQVCEIFDGDSPHKPRGCIAQAWSVAELIRAYQLIHT